MGFIDEISLIEGLDRRAMNQAELRWDSLTKPPKSLGKLEDVVIRIAGIQRDPMPRIGRKQVLCFAGDHGVFKEGVSPSRQSVTAEMVKNFVNGGAAISVLSRCIEADLKVINTGMVNIVDHPSVIQKSIAPRYHEHGGRPGYDQKTGCCRGRTGIRNGKGSYPGRSQPDCCRGNGGWAIQPLPVPSTPV